MKYPSEDEARRVISAMSREDVGWFAEKINLLAAQHDIAGPPIQSVDIPAYEKEISRQIQADALAALLDGEIKVREADLELVWPCHRSSALRRAEVEGKLSQHL